MNFLKGFSIQETDITSYVERLKSLLRITKIRLGFCQDKFVDTGIQAIYIEERIKQFICSVCHNMTFEAK